MASAGTAPAPISNQQQPTQPTVAPAKVIAGARVKAGARWFYWIAALSMVNSVVVIAGGSLHFVVGLGITTVVDVLAKGVGSAGTVLDLVINGTVAGIFFLFGSFAAKGQKWAFLVGMVLYGLDGLLLLGVKDILSVGFHAYALFAISRGLKAADQA
jgi:sirohydrochlorin ferrochelatase